MNHGFTQCKFKKSPKKHYCVLCKGNHISDLLICIKTKDKNESKQQPNQNDNNSALKIRQIQANTYRHKFKILTNKNYIQIKNNQTMQKKNFFGKFHGYDIGTIVYFFRKFSKINKIFKFFKQL
ncbi:hypothetical protein RFI_27410 [Reticulomyxa filosa]|uniref:Uncharacterized protein n=1 Tax=Reticulomyxa filosa TaxID=46433 RepID=X6M7K9_RETFI|nr:hypothetical protein RFI_27410 [Reticulomyxa filosa]|eukprot:ETO09968.1 hypothetical protein RFI_27410 [Reticulomyxa filosa]